MEGPLRLLVIEDSEDDLLLLERELRKGGISPVIRRVETAGAMGEALRTETWDLIISDYVMPGFSGLAALDMLKESGVDLPFIIVSGQIGEDAAVEAMKAGAHDYMLKGSLKRLVPAIEREMREAEVRRERRQALEELQRTKKDLERRVRERTAELLEIKDDLEMEILARREKEEQIEKALQEKETLLRELYHRTKNNMNVISGLITLQTASLRDDRSLQMFRDLQGRITSMSLVHQKLYQSGDLSNVSLRDYVADLSKELLNSYRTTSGRVTLKLDIESFSLSIDAIIPCGLVINELMANSLKYAFPGGRDGEIRIAGLLTGEGEIRISYSDNGIGLPEGIDLHKLQTLGLKLVKKLTEGQLGGRVQLKEGPEPGFLLSFREPHYIRRI